MPGGRSEEMVSASKLQALFRGNKQRKMVQEKMEKYKKQIADLEAKSKVWIKGYDPNTGLYYYWNSQTQVSQWEQPADFVDGGVNELMQAALKIQCAYRSRKARRVTDEQKRKNAEAFGVSPEAKAVAKDGKKGSSWMQLFDSSSRKYYYYNTETGKYQWDKPEGFMDGHKDNMVMNVMKIQCMWRQRQARKKVEDKKQQLRVQRKVLRAEQKKRRQCKSSTTPRRCV